MPLLVIAILVSAVAAILYLLLDSLRTRRTIRRLTSELSKEIQSSRDAELRQDVMFAANPYPMWVYDCESLRFLTVNDAAANAYGYSRDEFLGMTLVDIRSADDTQAFLEAAGEHHEGYNAAGVWRHRRKDGSTFFVEIMAFEFQKDGGRKEMILALDVTDRCRTEEALRESEASLRSLVDNAPFGIAQALLNTPHPERLNPALRNMLGGYSLEEALQLNIAEQIYADPKDRQRLLDVLRLQANIQGWETTFRKRDGGLLPVRITGSLTGGRDGMPEVFSSYIEDMTLQSKLEQQVRQVQKLEAVGRLAGGMAHDFNNVLLVIKLSTELMLGQITPESPFSKPLLHISNATDRAAGLTRQMAFGRQQVMQPRVINLNTVVAETINMLRQVIGEDIRLVTALSDAAENSRLDPDQLTQVIMNLAVNARDAMPEGGMLHIETATVNLDNDYAKEHPPVQPGRYVMLAVSDTGTGIDRSIVPRIFDPFFTTKEVGKGSGLGLSIIYGIVKQSGGYVWVYSEPGQGTTFKLYFPATTAALERQILRAEVSSRPAGEVILVAEDEDMIRVNVRECLQQLGYRVYEAASGAAVLNMCAELQGKVDLVLSDLVMPGMSGYELAKELGARYPGIGMLFMSGYTEDTAIRRDLLLRGNSFLQKPFSVADLTKAVREALVLQMVQT